MGVMNKKVKIELNQMVQCGSTSEFGMAGIEVVSFNIYTIRFKGEKGMLPKNFLCE